MSNSRRGGLNRVTQSREERSFNSHSTFESEVSVIPYIEPPRPRIGPATPVKSSTHSLQPPLTVDAMRSAIAAELSSSIVDKSTPAAKVFASYSKLPIAKFLADCDLYDNQAKEWTALKEAASTSTQEKVVYTPLSNIIHAIFAYFDKDTPNLRWVDQTHKKRITHVEDGATILQQGADGQTTPVISPKSSPDLAIMGRTTTFLLNATIAERSEYTHCLAPLEVKLETTFKVKKKEIAHQIAIYARYDMPSLPGHLFPC